MITGMPTVTLANRGTSDTLQRAQPHSRRFFLISWRALFVARARRSCFLRSTSARSPIGAPRCVGRGARSIVCEVDCFGVAISQARAVRAALPTCVRVGARVGAVCSVHKTPGCPAVGVVFEGPRACPAFGVGPSCCMSACPARALDVLGCHRADAVGMWCRTLTTTRGCARERHGPNEHWPGCPPMLICCRR